MLSEVLNGCRVGFLTIPYRMILKKDVSAVGALIPKKDPGDPHEAGNETIGWLHIRKQEHYNSAEESEQGLVCQD